MLSTYRAWRKSTIVMLVHGAGSWNVALPRKNKECRFGLGWSSFTEDNHFSAGQNLRLNYLGNLTFIVSLVE